MFTLNVGFLGCNGERGKEKSKVNFNFPVLQIYGRFIFSFYSDAGFCAYVRQTPPVGRSENLTGPSFLLQWSSATKPCIFRQHYRAKKESFIE